MFGRLFGSSSVISSDYITKTIKRNNKNNIDQNSWTKLLKNIDSSISKYHDYNDIILISSPYLIEHIHKSLDHMLDKLDLIYISPFIIQYLFGNKNDIESKLKFITTVNMKTINELMKTMSIIIIDITSSEMIQLPILSSNLLETNSINNKHGLYKNYWQMKWSTDSNVTSNIFRNIMTDICDQFKNDANIMNYFTICGRKASPTPNLNDSIQNLRQAITQLERREEHLDRKIQICLKNAKMKSKQKDKKGALFELKKKKQLERQLMSIQGSKLGMETQIMPLSYTNRNDKYYESKL
eukprot:295298_1